MNGHLIIGYSVTQTILNLYQDLGNAMENSTMMTLQFEPGVLQKSPLSKKVGIP